MKILHTADWHIGKKLHGFDLYQDFELFMQWLSNTIVEKQVTVLLISGDVFDLANPSSESRKQYYNAIVQLNKLNCQVVITGGNHDSPAMLNAPKDLLQQLNISVIGSMPNEPKECLIPLSNHGEIEIIVAAVPFLRDADLRRATQSMNYEDRLLAIQGGITETYKSVAEECKTLYEGIPVIAMGHLYAAGVSESDSEREIQIGNQAQFSADKFGEDFSYIALGHIHKPQRLKANTPSFYSGSPLPLSFSERKDQKRVLIIDTEKGFEPESIPVPNFRKLLRIQGDLETLEFELNALNEKLPLPILIEIILKEKEFNPDRILKLEETLNEFDKEGYAIVHRTTTFDMQVKGAGDLYDSSQNLVELKPIEVFDKLLSRYDYTEEINQSLKEAFYELVEEAEQKN